MTIDQFKERLLPMAGMFKRDHNGRIRHKAKTATLWYFPREPFPCCPVESLFDKNPYHGRKRHTTVGTLGLELGLSDDDVKCVIRTADNKTEDRIFDIDLYRWFVTVLCQQELT